MRKKLLLVTPYFPPHVGGAENYVYNLGRQLVNTYNWDVVVVTSNIEGKKEKIEHVKGMKVYFLPYWFKVSNTPINPFWYRKLRKIIREEKPDIVNAHTPVPFLADIAGLASRGTKFVLTYHSAGSSIQRGLFVDTLTFLYEKFLVRYVLHRADTIISSSDFVKGTFLKEFRKKTITITPGVSTQHFTPQKKKPGKSLLFVGSLKKMERYKGLEFLLKAVQRIYKRGEEVHLHVVGDGDYRHWYEQMAKSLGIEEVTTFHGRLQGKALVEQYQACDVFVHPSLFDSWPLVILEAMACAKPVVGTNTSGIPYMITNGENGYLFPPKDDTALADRLSYLLKHPKEAQKLGAAGRELIENKYSWNDKAHETHNLLLDVLHDKANPTRHKALLVTPYFLPHIGGVETYVQNLAVGLKRKGWDITIVTTESPGASPHLDGIKIIRLPYSFKLSNTPINTSWIKKLKEIVKNEQPTIINAHMPVPFLADAAASSANHVPVVITYHSGTMKKHRTFPDIFIALYELLLLRLTMRKANRIICSSDFVRNDFLAKYKSKSITITPGVDEKIFTPKYPYPKNNVLFVGRLEHNAAWKGVSYLLNAFVSTLQSIPEAKLVLVGGGDAVGYYKEAARKLGIEKNVRFLGPKSSRELVKVYQDASVVVLPSVSDAESFGIVLVEAGASGRPVIGSRVGGIPYVIDHRKTGLLVPPKNTKALADAMTSLLRDPKRATSMGAHGREKVMAEFTLKDHINAHDRLFREVEKQ